MRRLTFILALTLAGCAQQGFPPGGPEEKVPPKLLSVVPESGAVNVHPKELRLKFDEVINERPASASELSQLVLISPRDGAPRVGWHRSSLTIRGRKDFRPNTAYTITILPGISDLRGNSRKETTVIVFSTGAAIPNTRITGVAYDWAAGRPLINAAIEAIGHPDTTIVYVARADSVGAFEVAHLPSGTYTVRGYNDINSNRVIDGREAWDSTHIVLRDNAHVELLTFIHDTISPRVNQVAVTDSVTIRATFDQPLDPGQSIDTSRFTLKAPDSTLVPLRFAQSAAAWDSANAAKADTSREQADTAKPPERAPQRTGADTTKRKELPKPSRPSPISEVVIGLAKPLVPGNTYHLETRNVKNLLGRSSNGSKAFTVPKASPADLTPSRAPADTTKRPPADTSKRPPADTSKRPPR